MNEILHTPCVVDRLLDLERTVEELAAALVARDREIAAMHRSKANLQALLAAAAERLLAQSDALARAAAKNSPPTSGGARDSAL